MPAQTRLGKNDRCCFLAFYAFKLTDFVAGDFLTAAFQDRSNPFRFATRRDLPTALGYFRFTPFPDTEADGDSPRQCSPVTVHAFALTRACPARLRGVSC
jgi:hypothetical protein